MSNHLPRMPLQNTAHVSMWDWCLLTPIEQHDLCGLTAGCVGDIIFSKRGSYHDE